MIGVIAMITAMRAKSNGERAECKRDLVVECPFQAACRPASWRGACLSVCKARAPWGIQKEESDASRRETTRRNEGETDARFEDCAD